MLQGDALPRRLCWTHSKTMLNSFIVLIIYSQQVSIFMKQLLSTHSRFCSAKKKKEVVCEAQTHDLHVTARRSTTPKKKTKRSCLCEARTQDLPIIAQHTKTAPYHGARSKLFNSERTSWEHYYVGLLWKWSGARSGSPQQWLLWKWSAHLYSNTVVMRTYVTLLSMCSSASCKWFKNAFISPFPRYFTHHRLNCLSVVNWRRWV